MPTLTLLSHLGVGAMPGSKAVDGFSAALLVQRRKEAGKTQQQLADATGLPRQMVTRLESGKGPGPSGETLDKLANALGVPAATLLEAQSAQPDLRQLRSRARLTQDDVATQLQRGRSWYAMLELGRIQEMPEVIAGQLARLFGTDIGTVNAAHQAAVSSVAARPATSLTLTAHETAALARLLETLPPGPDRDLLTARLRRDDRGGPGPADTARDA
jgi:transcriptional regulator with XRE-family HTH domain